MTKMQAAKRIAFLAILTGSLLTFFAYWQVQITFPGNTQFGIGGGMVGVFNWREGPPAWRCAIYRRADTSRAFAIKPFVQLPHDAAPGYRSGWCFFLPLWPIPTALYIAWKWRRNRSSGKLQPQNLCPKCKYSRSGLTKRSRCPECGTLIGN